MNDEPMNPRVAERLARAARAAQALSQTLWETLHEELSDPRRQRVVELSERLAEISATVGLLARADPGASPTGGRVAATQPEAPGVRAIHDEPSGPHETAGEASEPCEPSSTSRQPSGPRATPAWESSAGREASLPAVLIDELADHAPLAQTPSAPLDSAAPAPREIEIRDERREAPLCEQDGDEGDRDAWVGAIARRLERYERDRAPFAVLVVELADVERLRHAALPGEVARMTGLAEAALTGELRPADSLTRESPGRYWLLAPETDSEAARALVERLASAVRGAVSHRGAPLEVAVGIAVCPFDGSQAEALAAHAEIALYAARASGKPVA